MSLTTNQVKSEMKKKRWTVEGGKRVEQEHGSPIRGGPVDLSSSLVVELGPMEIRTLLVKF